MPAGDSLCGIMAAAGPNDGPDRNKLVHHPSNLGKQLTDFDARNVGCNGLELPADFARRVHFDVPHVLMRWAARKEDVYDRFVRPFDTCPGFGGQELRQS